MKARLQSIKKMEDIKEFLWKVGNDYDNCYPPDLVDEARVLLLKYNKELNT